MEKLAKLAGIDYKPQEYLYYVKSYPDGVYVCRSKMNRKGRK